MFLRNLFLPLVIGALTVALSMDASGTILVNEDFSHPDGDLVGQTPTPGPGSAWGAHSGGGSSPIQVTSGAAVLQQAGGGREDASTGFAVQSATATTYSRFDFSLPSGQTVDPDDFGLYFAHLKDSGNAFRARVGVVTPAAGGDFILGFNASGSRLSIADGASHWPTELSFDTNYTVVTSYNAETGVAELWLDPVDQTSPHLTNSAGGATGTLIEAFALRQSNDYTGSQIVDNVCVASSFGEALTCRAIPEPSCLVLIAGLALCGVAGRKGF
ncbi:hypothetical protein [Bythopirellula polymerisocia]|uniref:PEP-CTERM protein-sorting domain-containing protein n=1 Tax=Bythopirellula polymerisocia TaxID=2528003 RepID=A0A5C6C8C2_9BACT|nr:hypothetical protein [Bythopirellula polymerisocia]TWU20345.1 hypothetical protein Pla144_49920 [Bythopirellula polymerisocia]